MSLRLEWFGLGRDKEAVVLCERRPRPPAGRSAFVSAESQGGIARAQLDPEALPYVTRASPPLSGLGALRQALPFGHKAT